MSRPVQIVRTSDDNHFELCHENLEEIISQIPAGMKVGVVSVVGAFRTGKSFLLNFFLRYLRHGNVSDMSDDWMTKDGDQLSEGNLNDSSADASTLSFGWRGGEERQTTGIWMWSQPFIRYCARTGEDIAVILVDTQGMFDNETTMTTTAQIFGLSTLISSYQIYNVEKRIQEDNLQHLALFSEYGRMALDKEKPSAVDQLPTPPPLVVPDTILPPKPPAIAPSAPAAAVAVVNVTVSPTESINSTGSSMSETEEGFVAVPSSTNDSKSNTPKSRHSTNSADIPDTNDSTAETEPVTVTAAPVEPLKLTISATPEPSATDSTAPTTPVRPPRSLTRCASTSRNVGLTRCGSRIVVTKPFQRLQFLVRDWQNFDVDWEDAGDDADKQSELYRTMRGSMDTYLFNVIKDRGMADLQTTREQIVRCFETVDCFLLPHPGFSVTKKTFNGAINKIDAAFKGLLNRYVRLVFDENIEPKQMNNRSLTGRELQRFFEVYCRMFQDTNNGGDGTGCFPKAMTMLEATSEANNRNAFDAARADYVKGMDVVAGNACAFIKDHLLMEHHDRIEADVLTHFDDVATMGAEVAIEAYRTKLTVEIESLRVNYFETNALKNPFKDLELYLLPAAVAVASWFIAKIIDASCNHAVCEATELAFTRIYGLILFVIAVLAWKQLSGAAAHIQRIVLPLIQSQLSQVKA